MHEPLQFFKPLPRLMQRSNALNDEFRASCLKLGHTTLHTEKISFFLKVIRRVTQFTFGAFKKFTVGSSSFTLLKLLPFLPPVVIGKNCSTLKDIKESWG